ncbi:MAG: hypothetical protein JOZ47_04845 [Kutzneria sp.]|nr:hypothetical protein [Kutzneria sp.]
MADATAATLGTPASAVAKVKSFVAAHGEPTRAVVEHLGRAGARVVLVGADGAMGDVVVADSAVGEAVCARVPGVRVSEWDHDTVAATKIGARHRRRMAGSRAWRA